jgi:hypothetical protein
MRAKKEKVQCPIRLYSSDYQKIKQKVVDDKITFQKLAEVLFLAYLKGNKETQRLVSKYADDNNVKRRRNYLSELENNELLREIEENFSPLRLLEQALGEVKKGS